MDVQYGTYHWHTTPTDPQVGPLIAAECAAYTRTLGETRRILNQEK